MNAPYRDRTEAGQLLGIHIAALVKGPTVVAGIPRGGVVVAAPVADRLGSPLTLTHVGKISLAMAPESGMRNGMERLTWLLRCHALRAPARTACGRRPASSCVPGWIRTSRPLDCITRTFLLWGIGTC